mmetsp:Transcript_85258/g.260647  ORF Transcript_85258/g.260647 Transcript_85258/m.260647 type:complete len:505 (-) Transcript_85258:22-1536(-)
MARNASNASIDTQAENPSHVEYTSSDEESMSHAEDCLGDPGPDADGPSAVDLALEEIGFGRFQVFMMAICGMGWFADSIEAGGLAYIYTTLDEEWGTTTADWGRLASAKSLCSVFGALSFGTAADCMGRRPAFLLALLVTVVGGIASAGAYNFPTLLVLRCVANFGAGGLLPVAISLAAENLPPSSRDACMVFMQIFFVLGYVLAVVISMVLPKSLWRIFLVALAAPGALLLLAAPCMSESPAYLLQRGREEKAQRALGRIHYCNTGKHKHFDLFPKAVSADKKAGQGAQGILRLFADRRVAMRLSLFGLLWFFTMAASDFTTWMTELGHMHGVGRHSVERFMIAAKFIGVTAFLTAAYMSRGGRGPAILRGAYVAAAAAAVCAATSFALGASGPLLTGAVGLLFYPFDVVWALLYATTASAFDASCKATAVSLCTTCSRTAAALVPLVTGKLLETNQVGALGVWTGAWAAAALLSCFVRFREQPLAGKAQAMSPEMTEASDCS